jgi:hypothetical protein
MHTVRNTEEIGLIDWSEFSLPPPVPETRNKFQFLVFLVREVSLLVDTVTEEDRQRMHQDLLNLGKFFSTYVY